MKCFKCLKILNEVPIYGLHKKCFLKWFNLTEPLEFSDLELRSESDPKKNKVNKNEISWTSSFFHGNFKKYSANLGNDSYILKVKEQKYPELPEVEYISNQIANFLKIPVPKFYIISLFGQSVFVTKNFCRTSTTIMSLDHIYKYLKEDSQFDCETLMNTIFKITGKYNDIYIFIQTCLYDSLVGNHDRHGRNLGIIVTSKGSRLAPIYDNPSMLGLESGDFLKMHWNPKGKIFTQRSQEPTPKDYIEEFKRLGHSEIVNEFIKNIDQKKILKIIDNGFCSPLMKTALKNLTSERIKEFHDSDKG